MKVRYNSHVRKQTGLGVVGVPAPIPLQDSSILFTVRKLKPKVLPHIKSRHICFSRPIGQGLHTSAQFSMGRRLFSGSAGAGEGSASVIPSPHPECVSSCLWVHVCTCVCCVCRGQKLIFGVISQELSTLSFEIGL